MLSLLEAATQLAGQRGKRLCSRRDLWLDAFPVQAHMVELQGPQLFVPCALSWRAPLCTLSSACALADPSLDQIELKLLPLLLLTLEVGVPSCSVLLTPPCLGTKF